jgi:hypothetical protein
MGNSTGIMHVSAQPECVFGPFARQAGYGDGHLATHHKDMIDQLACVEIYSSVT